MTIRKTTLKDAVHLLIAEYGAIEFAERYKSIYEDFDQEVYGKAVAHLELFLEELLQIEQQNENQQESSETTLSEAAQSSRLTQH